VRSIAEMVRDMIDPALPLGFGEVSYKADEVMHLESNIDRIMRDTGWRPRVSLDQGIQILIESIRGLR